ncbi:hypothetical protein PtB15_17B67 [Puccinia triticina]|nr:hypothetical protein PtB15_17B67 [Puccinia triticina]
MDSPTKSIAWDNNRILVNSTPSDKSPATSPQQEQQEDSAQESYMKELLAETQAPLAELSTASEQPSSPLCAPPVRPSSTRLADDPFHTDLHFPDGRSFSLGPETQKARMSMENNARLLQQELSLEHSSLFSHFQPDSQRALSAPNHSPPTPPALSSPQKDTTTRAVEIEDSHDESIPAAKGRKSPIREDTPSPPPSSSSDAGQDGAMALQKDKRPAAEDEQARHGSAPHPQGKRLLIEEEESAIAPANPSSSDTGQDGAIPLQSTYSGEDGARSPHPPDVTLDLAFDQDGQLEDSHELDSGLPAPLGPRSKPLFFAGPSTPRSGKRSARRSASSDPPSALLDASSARDESTLARGASQPAARRADTPTPDPAPVPRAKPTPLAGSQDSAERNGGRAAHRHATSPVEPTTRMDARVSPADASISRDGAQTPAAAGRLHEDPGHEPPDQSAHDAGLPPGSQPSSPRPDGLSGRTETARASQLLQRGVDEHPPAGQAQSGSQRSSPVSDEPPRSDMPPQRDDPDVAAHQPPTSPSASRDESSTGRNEQTGPIETKRKRAHFQPDLDTHPALPESDEEDSMRLEPRRARTAAGSRRDPPASRPAPSTRPVKQTSTTSPVVSVVVPRLRKAKAARAVRSKAVRTPGPAPSDAPAAIPVPRVLAWRTDWEAFGPGTVVSVTPDKVVVRYDDGVEEAREVGQLRLCHIGAGDVVQYIGTDLAEGESQVTGVRKAKRVVRVEKAEECAGTPISSRHDLLVTCEASEDGSATGPAGESRFLVEAVMLVPPGPRRHTGLKDRLLPQQIVHELRELMKAHSGVGMRAKLAVPPPRPAPLGALFHGLGILLTGAAPPLAPRPASSRKPTPSSPTRSQVEQLIRDHHGLVIAKVSELYEITGTDLALDPSELPAPLDPDLSYRLSPAPKHEKLRAILLVADAPVKTLKYLMALALGIPCVSTKWVTHSCDQGYALDWEKYLIGPGPSVFLGAVPALVNLQLPILHRPAHHLRAVFDAREPLLILRDKSVVYVSSKAKPKSDWNETVKPILCASGATRLGFVETKGLAEAAKRGDIL